MPPKKKCAPKARKTELIFLERPREGPIHSYATPLPSAENPRRVPTKPVDHNTSASWVSPQFETAKAVVLKACQKQQHGPPKAQKHHRGPPKAQSKDASHSLLPAAGPCQKATTCKFPPLTFENPEGFAPHSSDHPSSLRKNTECSHRQPKKGTAAKAKSQVNRLELCRERVSPQPVEPEVFNPPDTETPQASSIKNQSTLPDRSSHAWHPGKELAFGPEPCGDGESPAVLVTDTLEHEYGVKVTWRRRPHVMRYLLERG
ncbi:RHNO1 protein, partial [Bucco capensis]|nr:RHNO1 protein [Bucco capensis]